MYDVTEKTFQISTVKVMLNVIAKQESGNVKKVGVCVYKKCFFFITYSPKFNQTPIGIYWMTAGWSHKNEIPTLNICLSFSKVPDFSVLHAFDVVYTYARYNWSRQANKTRWYYEVRRPRDKFHNYN